MPATLLIVDDEPKIRAMLSACLAQDGLTITTAASGEEALDLIPNDPPQPLIVDVKMPGLNGLEVLRRVRATTPQVGVFLLTGFDDDSLEQEAQAPSAWGVIHKPPVLAEVRQLIRVALAKLPPA